MFSEENETQVTNEENLKKNTLNGKRKSNILSNEENVSNITHLNKRMLRERISSPTLDFLKTKNNSEIYNKIIQLINEEFIFEKNNLLHNFHYCNVCTKRNSLINLQTIEISKILGYINTDRSTNERVIDNYFPEELFLKEVSEKENNQLMTYKINQKDFNSQASSLEALSEVEFFFNYTKFKIEKLLENLLAISEVDEKVNKALHNSSKNELEKLFELIIDDTIIKQFCFNTYLNYKTEAGDNMREEHLSQVMYNEDLTTFLISWIIHLYYTDKAIYTQICENIFGIKTKSIIEGSLAFIKTFLEKIIEQNQCEMFNFIDSLSISALKNSLKSISEVEQNIYSSILTEEKFQNVSDEESEEEFNEFDKMGSNEIFNISELASTIKSSSSDSDSDEEYLVTDLEDELIRIPPRNSFFLTYSKMNTKSIQEIYRLASQMGFGVSEKFIQNVTTHVIIPENWYEKSFSYQYLAGVAEQTFIVTIKWILDCLDVDRILPPYMYIPNQPGANSCTLKNRRYLFKDYSIYFPEKEELLTKKQFEHLAKACGAEICKKIETMKGKRILISAGKPNPEILEQCVELGVYPVSSSWLVESIAVQMVQPLKPHCLFTLNNVMSEILITLSHELSECENV